MSESKFEERRKTLGQIGKTITVRDYLELMIDWEIEDINEFMHTKGSRLRTKKLRLKREADARSILLGRINRSCGIKETGIPWGELNYGYYLREKRRRKRREEKVEE